MKRIAFLIALAASAAAFAATATKATLGDLGMNAQVVTNVDFSGLSMTETDPEFNTFTNSGGVMYGPLAFPRTISGMPMPYYLSTNGVTFWNYTTYGGGGGYWYEVTRWWGDFLTSESDPNVPAWAKASSKPSYTWDEISGKPSFKTVATSGAYSDLTGKPSIPSVPADIGAASAADVNTLSQNVSTVVGYLQGDDAKVVITNFDSSVEMPAASFQQKISDGGTNYWRTIWNELTRWTWLTDTYLPSNYVSKAEIGGLLDEKADRAWGFYESHSGFYAPDGYTWISSPKIAIAAGLAYQRTITSEGAVWVLQSNGLVTETGGNVTNGFFRISDDDGNAMFEIVKGNKRTIGAAAGGVRTEEIMGITHIYVTYNVVSESHPTAYVCNDLSAGNWKAETSGDCIANVSWTGSSGAYVVEVWGKTQQIMMFVKAEYEVGGETYIKNTAPISADGGILCTDGIHKVRPVYNNGSITWEVVQ